MPFLKDIYDDVKMRGGKNAAGISFVQWYEYSRLPEVIAQRLFDVFNVSKSGALSLEEFAGSLASVFISQINTKMELTFKVFDIKGEQKIEPDHVKHVLFYCDHSALEEDLEGEKSPKEGKYSASMNTYLSFIHRNF